MTETLPEWVVPMAATLTPERFAGPEWTFERKLDGIRLLAFRREGAVSLYSRNRLPQHNPAVSDAVGRLPGSSLILDGELTWGAEGVRYHVFDVLWRDGSDLRGLSLDDRRRILEDLPFAPPLERVLPLDEPLPWERACREGWEGVIAKRRASVYESRRSKDWLKMKCELSQDFVVGGFTDPQGGRAGFGALLVGYFSGDDLVFAGKVGTGFDTTLLLGLRARLDAIEIPKAPFTRAAGLPRLRAHWVRPEILIRAAFLEWTDHDKLRHSRLLGLVDGRDPRTVTRGEP